MRQLLANFSFDKLDANKDGSLTQDEVTKGTFAWLDKNNDKFLDLNELAKLPPMTSKGEEARNKEEERKEKKEQEKEREKEKGNAKGADSPDKPPMIVGAQDPKKPSQPKKEKEADPKDEKEEAKLRPAKEHMARMDANKDGKISHEEFALPEEWWGQVDIDHDGKISKDEFLGKSKREKDDKNKDDKNKDGKKAAIKLANMSGEEAFAELDSNKDGKVSPDEWSLNPKMFEKVDADGDGFLSKEEVAEAVKVYKQMMKGRSNDGGADGGTEKPEPKKGKPATEGDKKPVPKPGENPPL